MIGIQDGVLRKYIGSEEKIIIPDGVTKIDSLAFGRYSTGKEENPCPNLKEVVLPETVREISDDAFCHCETLEKINLPHRLKKIGKSAFHWCRSLEEIIIPDGISEIPAFAFAGCYSLKKIHIPESVKHIGLQAFHGCHPEKLIIPEKITNLSPDVCGGKGYRANIAEVSYQNIQFSARQSDDVKYGIDIYSCIKLINEHDISVQIPSPEKEYIIFQLYCKYPDDKEFIRFLKEKFSSKFRVLIDRNKPEIVRQLLENGKFITKNNINSCLFYSAEHNTPEITLLLTDYKYRHFGYEDIETIISRKFAL